MNWQLVPALLAALTMTVFGVGALIKPTSLAPIGVSATSPLGTSEIRVVFGGMFVALGVACLVTRDPLVFATVGAAWLADFVVRLAAIVIDRVTVGQAAVVLAIALAMGSALASGYWLA
jgi:hypothetical protein